MSMNLGINVVEVDGKATPSIQGASTSVAGFIVRSRRGVHGAVRLVTSYRQFVESFGDVMSAAFGAYAVRGFFDNGGATAYVVRAVTDAAPATATLATGQSPNETPVLKVTAGHRGAADPGAWGNDLKIDINGAQGVFTLSVLRGDEVLESWGGLKIGGTGAQDPNQINHDVSGSKYIKVEVPANASGTPNNGQFPLANGKDDTPADTNANSDPAPAATAVLSKLDTVDIQLLCCPETASKTFAVAAIAYCTGRSDCLFVGHVDMKLGPDNAKDYTAPASNLRGGRGYGAIYFPAILVADPLGTSRWIPPTGHILGVYARTERERGVWKAPAGSAARLEGALDVRHALNDTEHTNLVKLSGINAVRAIPGEGIVVDSSRTLASNPLWLYVNVRLLFNYVKTSLKYGLRWTAQEPNDTALRNKVKHNSITPFLMGLWRRGAFGPGAPDKVFSVVCDGTNNPDANVQQGIFNVEVYFYPSRPAETIIITVGQQDGGSTATER